jgi:siroheme synthase
LEFYLVVPGISSSIAVPASQGISLKKRRVREFLTGTTSENYRQM